MSISLQSITLAHEENGAHTAINWPILVSVLFAGFMEVLDGTVVNVSMPYIAGGFSAPASEATWALTSYLAANAVFLPITGWVVYRVGRKNTLLFSLVMFAIASACCAISHTLAELVIFRVFQGASGALMQPIAYAIALEAFPTHDRVRATVLMGLVTTIAPTIGPLLGGWITSELSWPWIFLINVPIAMFSAVMVYWFVPRYHPVRIKSEAIDYFSLSLLAVAVTSFQVVLSKGQDDDWFSSRFIMTLCVIAIISALVFIYRQLLTAQPVLDLLIFSERCYSIGVILIFIQSFVLFGCVVLLPLILQIVMGYTALDAGITILPRGLGAIAGIVLAGMVVKVMPPRLALIIGLTANGISSLFLMHINLSCGYWDFFFPQLLGGVSSAFTFVPIATLAFGRVPQYRLVHATSLFGFASNIGSALGIAATTALLFRNAQELTSFVGSHITIYNQQSTQRLSLMQDYLIDHGVDHFTAHHQSIANTFIQVTHQSMLLSANNIFGLMSVLSFAGILLVMIIGSTSQPHIEMR